MGEVIMPIKWTYNPFTDELDAMQVGRNSGLGETKQATAWSITGLDGDRNRTITTTVTSQIAVDNQLLQIDEDYSYSSGVITFLNEIWDTQYITIW